MNNSRFNSHFRHNINTTNPSRNINEINNVNNYNNDNINSRQYISVLYTLYNNNYRLINELRNDNLLLSNHIVNEYERSLDNPNHTRLNSRTQFPRTPFSIFNNFNSAFFDRVLVPPSNEQIQLSTITTYYSNVIDPLNTSCPITLEEFENNSVVCLIKHCGHIFKPEPLYNWFSENNSNRCPVCRYDVRNYTTNTEDNYELTDSSNIIVDNTTENDDNNSNNNSNINTNINSNINSNNNNTNINSNNNTNNNSNLRLNTVEELTNQIDNFLTQLFNNNSSSNNDISGNFVITYTL